jgi:hypothetical protein
MGINGERPVCPQFSEQVGTGLSLLSGTSLYTANNGFTWAWNFTKSFVKGPSTGPGSCVGVFTDTATAPLKQVYDNVKNYVPIVVGALRSAPSLTSAAGNYIAYMGYFTSTPADETAEAITGVSTVGAAATTAAP